MTYNYQKMDFDDFVNSEQATWCNADLFELSLPWLQATKTHMLAEQAQVVVHCLFQKTTIVKDEHCDERPENPLLIAWPLVHENHTICSLTSFYSAVAEPLIAEPLFTEQSNESALKYLLECIVQKNLWHTLSLGPLSAQNVVFSLLNEAPIRGCYQKVFNRTDNFYQNDLESFEQYAQQLPSQLKNTIKRRRNKLIKQHQLDIEIVSERAQFSSAFDAYKAIYQLSWKSDEFSFAFIEQVCLFAMNENKLRLGLLRVDNKPAAAQIWFLEENGNKKSASIFKLAYSPDYAEFSVGSILSLALSEHVIDIDKVNSIEFGMGSEAYKADWLSQQRKRNTYQLFNKKTFKGNLAAFMHVFLPKVKQLLFST